MPEKRYIRTILPLRLEWEPCYCLPEAGLFASGAGTGIPDAAPHIGDRIKVPFNGKTLVAVVCETDATPDIDRSKIQTLPCYEPVLKPVSRQEMELWRFIAGYYCCTLGEVYKAAYPASKTESESIKAAAEKRADTMREKAIAQWQERIKKLKSRLYAKDVALGKKHKESICEKLRAERAAIVAELESARKRLETLQKELFDSEDSSSRIIAGLPAADGIPAGAANLAAAIASGSKAILYKGSDRARQYILTASETLRKGRSVLILVPETATATVLRKELESVFGELLMIFDAKTSPAGRRRIADALREGKPRVILGIRTSIFLPFKDLGLIIIDNEQSPFYKQEESAPRYNARDCAVWLAAKHGCPVILGSSSPSLESLYNCSRGRYTLIEDSASSPVASSPIIVDMPAEKRKNGVVGFFSRKLLEAAEGKARIALIRGYENEEELASEAAAMLKCDFEIFTIPGAARSYLGDFDLVALMSADALFRADDFRADERAFQYLDALRHSCREVVVQTKNAAHRVFSMQDTAALMEERRRFNLPPFSRIVYLLVPGSQILQRLVLQRGLSVSQRQEAIKNAAAQLYSRSKGRIVIDVDPI